MKPHEGLNDETPVNRAGIKVEGENKWLTIIQNAAKLRTVDELDGGRQL